MAKSKRAPAEDPADAACVVMTNDPGQIHRTSPSRHHAFAGKLTDDLPHGATIAAKMAGWTAPGPIKDV